jgi:hypothetical protein
VIGIEDSASGAAQSCGAGRLTFTARGSTRSKRSVSRSIDMIAVVVRSSAGVATLATGNGFASTVLAKGSDVPIDTGDFETAPVAARAAEGDSPCCATDETDP